MTGDSLERLVRIIKEQGMFDQMIVYPTFVHVSYKRIGTNRHQVLKKVSGGYASQKGFDPTLDRMLTSFRNDVFTVPIVDFTFYKSKEILSYRAHCLYGLNSNNMHMRDIRSQDHKFHQAGVVKKEYFHGGTGDRYLSQS